MNSGSRTGERRYAQKVEKPSKVLLVCIYDTVVIDITNEIIRSKFDEFGKITKMLIFEKGEVTKLFLQYDLVDQAMKAKNKLDGTKLYEAICKMTIYYSNFSNVEVANEPTDDPYQQQNELMIPQGTHHRSSMNEQLGWTQGYNGKQAYNIDIDDDQIMESFNSFTKEKRSRTENPNFLAWEFEKLNHPISNTQHQPKFIQIKHQKKQSGWMPKKQEQKTIKMKQDTDIRSSVLWFPYRYPIKPKHIYNLFSNFGNISSVIVKKQNAFIKFRSKQFAAMASTYLNNTVLLGNIMDLRECPQDSNSWKLQQGEYSQSVYYDLNYDRFTSQRSITINPPANTIHISSIKREICKEKNLWEIFSKFGQVQKIQILQNSVDKNMALVKFQTLEDSFNVIAELHNEVFLGRKMQISFTKSKL